jgi:predicted MPP superfamily phosphohydrolase
LKLSRRRGWLRVALFALVIAGGVQAPILWGLARLGVPLPPVLGAAGALTAGFFATLVGPRAFWGAPSRVRLYLVLWPFFVWWTVALLFGLLLPVAFAVRAALPISTAAVLRADLIAAAVGAVIALRQKPRVHAREVFIAGLPEAFDGLRVAQISDLHCGPFASGARVDRWVAAVNRLSPDIVAVTGDLIGSGSAFVPVVAASLGRLRAPDGVFACMGNHDYFTDGDEVAHALERAGLTLLRNRGVEVRRGDAALYVAGVDDTWTKRNDLERTLADRPAGAPVLLLAHDPALFPEAAARGVDLTLSGHTHGGQLGLPFFARRLNLARLMTPFTTDFYRLEDATLYVNRGLGTTGPPVRLAVPPEIALLTLRRARDARAGGGPVRSSSTSDATRLETPIGISSRNGTRASSADSQTTNARAGRSPGSGAPS